MQRWRSKLRSIAAAVNRPTTTTISLVRPHRLLHASTNLLHSPFTAPLVSSNFKPLISAPSASKISLFNQAYPPTLSLIQVRHLTLKQRKRHLKVRRAPTPIVSKVKKIKMKSYSSYKRRFRTMNDGLIRRWKEGKRHNAHLKLVRASPMQGANNGAANESKISKRRLRRPGIVPPAYAKVMKKLNFLG